jgi:hypothetical protein
VFAAARSHTFAQLADAIDDAFARWDRAHLHTFSLADGTSLTTPFEDDEEQEGSIDDRSQKLSLLQPGEQVAYEFDLGDSWTHLCTVGPERIDPLDELGVVPARPMAIFGWGNIPDQYGRRWDADDGDTLEPPDPGYADLPPLRRHWGAARRLED